MSGTIHKDGIPERIGSGTRDVCDWLQFTALGKLVCLAVFFYVAVFCLMFTSTGLQFLEYLDMAFVGFIKFAVGARWK